MFATTIRLIRSIGRSFGRIAIEKREAELLAETRKKLLGFKAADEKSIAMTGMLRQRVERLREDLVKATAGDPEARRFDWIRFDKNTLATAIRDDLYEAEKQLHEEEFNYEGNSFEVLKLQAREKRLVASLEARKAARAPTAQEKMAAAAATLGKPLPQHPAVEQLTSQRPMAVANNHGVEYDGRTGRLDLVPASA